MTEDQRAAMREEILRAMAESAPEWNDSYLILHLLGTRANVTLPEEAVGQIWRCPSCGYWLRPDYNHDSSGCCVCAGCTKNPFLKGMQTVQA